MSISIIYILFALLDISKSQWSAETALLFYNQIFNQTPDRYNVFWQNWHFTQSSVSTPANFITCTTPQTSHITLNSQNTTAKYNYSCTYDFGHYVTIDLFFQGMISYHSVIHTWLSQNVQFTIGTFSKTYTYTSPANYPMTTGFCNTIPFEVKTWKFAIPSLQSGQPQFISLNTNSGQVSISNFVVSRIFFICYSSCSECTGPQFNQCTSCYYGTPTNNICPSCPSNQYYEKYFGCKDICDIDQSLYSKGFCNRFEVRTIKAEVGYTDSQNIYWFEIYDPQNIDTSSKRILTKQLFGIFRFNSGFYRFFKQNYYSIGYDLLGFKIRIVAFNDIPINCGIKFMIMEIFNYNLQLVLISQSNYRKIYVPNNNTYYGSIYRNQSGIQTHIFKIYETQLTGSYLNYSSSKAYDLITYFGIPKYSFLFSATGNYTDNTAGWAISNIIITQGFCHENCRWCNVEKGVYFLYLYHLYVRPVIMDTIYIEMVQLNEDYIIIVVYTVAHLHIRNKLALIAKIMMMKHLVSYNIICRLLIFS